MPQVTLISPQTKQQINKKRVAAYCRVSTSSADQLNSYARQIKVYTSIIQKNNEWQMVEIFADEGISGTSVDKRPEFLRMIRMCELHQIDLIITKSISRFARNVKETLEYVRKLKLLGVGVQFEKEGINTLSIGDEMLLNTFSAIAQEESVSISVRLRNANSKRMNDGDFYDGNAPYGYRMIDRVMTPFEPEAQVVRDIYNRYLSGMSTHEIARVLNEEGILSKMGVKWCRSSVQYILKNEKYIGDCLRQKTYHTSTFPFKQKRNYGQEDKYYISQTHEGIIERDKYEKVNEIMSVRREKLKSDAPITEYILTGKMHCNECGAFFTRKKNNGCVLWVCSNHVADRHSCPSHYYREEHIYEAFITMVNKLRFGKEKILENTLCQIEYALNIYKRNNREAYQISQEISELNAKLLMLEQLRSKGFLAPEVYQMQSREISVKVKELKGKRFSAMDTRIEDVKELIADVNSQIVKINEPLEAFDEDLFKAIVTEINICKNDTATFTLKGGLSFCETL